MKDNFKFTDLIVKMPNLEIDPINIKIRTTENISIDNQHEKKLHDKISIIGYDNFKGASVLANIYSLVNINNIDLFYLKKILNIDKPRKCIEKKKILTRAYYKLWEIVDHFKLLDGNFSDGLVSSNVAEGPGGFIQAIIYYRAIHNKKEEYLKDKVYGISLKVEGHLNFDNENKVVKKFREVYESKYKILNISYGGDNGDLTKIDVIRTYVNQFSKNKADIFTGDGGIVSNISLDKELLNGQLILCEAIVGLAVLKVGGHFVLKIYTVTQPFTIELIQLLSSYFDEFYITKPVTSRIFNTEKYLVGKGFKGIKDSELEKLFDLVKKLKQIQNDNKYIYSIFGNKINTEINNQIEKFNNVHFKIRLKLFDKIKFILDSNKKKDGRIILNNIKKMVEYKSYKWCKMMKLGFMIEE